MSPILIWFFAGLLLVLLEFVVPGVVLVFFGIAAWIVTVLIWLGLLDNTTAQLLVYCVVSLCLLFGLRRWVKGWFMGSSMEASSDSLEEFIGKEVLVLGDIPGGQATGKVEHKGAEWRARSEAPIAKGQLAVVLSRDGLVLTVRPLA